MHNTVWRTTWNRGDANVIVLVPFFTSMPKTTTATKAMIWMKQTKLLDRERTNNKLFRSGLSRRLLPGAASQGVDDGCCFWSILILLESGRSEMRQQKIYASTREHCV